MASTYSSSLKIQLMANGEDSGTWGTNTNTNWNLIEQAVAGIVTISMSNANYTMSNLNGVSDEARNMVLNVTGTNSAIYQVIAPLVSKFYIVSNNTTGGYAITIGASTGATVTIPNGITAQVYCDGSTGFYSAQTGSAGNFNVNGNLTVVGNSNIVPTGSLLMWATPSAPSGYLICNGQSVSTSTYANLFSAIGYTFGGSGGSFLVPNYTNRMPYGTTLGATGGSVTTTLSAGNLPGHSHNYSGTTGGMNANNPHGHGGGDYGHNHGPGAGDRFLADNGPELLKGGPDLPFTRYPTTAIGYAQIYINASDINHGHAYSGTSDNGNGLNNTAFNTISPYLGINFIIKT